MNKRIILLVCVLLIGFASVATAPVAANETADTDEFDEHFESTIAEFPNGAEFTHAEITDGEVVVYIEASSSAVGDEVIITDGTARDEFAPRETFTLDEGENVYSLNLANPDTRLTRAGVSIDTGGELYPWTEPGTDLRDVEEVGNLWALSIGGMLFLFFAILAVGQLLKRNSDVKHLLKT